MLHEGAWASLALHSIALPCVTFCCIPLHHTVVCSHTSFGVYVLLHHSAASCQEKLPPDSQPAVSVMASGQRAQTSSHLQTRLRTSIPSLLRHHVQQAAAACRDAFTPYLSVGLADSLPPAFLPGYPTAANISGDGLVLVAATYEPANVSYMVVPTSAVRIPGPSHT